MMYEAVIQSYDRDPSKTLTVYGYSPEGATLSLIRDLNTDVYDVSTVVVQGETPVQRRPERNTRRLRVR